MTYPREDVDRSLDACTIKAADKLEFDAIVVEEPQAVIAREGEEPRRAGDLMSLAVTT